jgi:phosphate acetyltransferase
VRVVFPEGDDPRVLSAAEFMRRKGWARPCLLGDPERVREKAREAGISIEGIPVADPSGSPDREVFAQRLVEKRKARGMTLEEARALVLDPLYFGAMMVEGGGADVFVGGAARSTADTVRAGFAALGMASGAETAFGAFFMECPHATGGTRRLLMADAAVSPHPSPRALAAVAAASAGLWTRYTGETSRVAFLSFSTLGSARDESVEAVRKAVELARRKVPGGVFDGEFQADTALVESIARRKGVTDFAVAGKANVLVFPDLNAGNIAYKLVQHLGGARAVGPLVAGLAKPFSDLSRGCTDEDVADTAVLASLL